MRKPERTLAGIVLVLVAVLCALPVGGSEDGANQKTAAKEDERSTTPEQPEATPVGIDKALLRYLKVSEDAYAPGYLGADGVFYKFRDTEPLDASGLPAGEEEKRWRVVQGDHKTIDIERPERLQFVSWKDGTYRAACWAEDRATLLVFTGFRSVRAEEIPWALGPISRTSPLEWDKLECKIVEIKGPDDAAKADGEAKEPVGK